MERKIGCRTIGIHVRKAAGHDAGMAGDFVNGFLRRRLDLRMEIGKAIPRDRGFEGLGDDAAWCEHLAEVRHAQEAVAPLSRSAFSLRALLYRRRIIVFPAMLPHDL